MANLTFWELTRKYKIEIPVLQRDYAQGRLRDNIRAIREKFVDDMVTCITVEEDKKLYLDFIYGKVILEDYADEQQRKKDSLVQILQTVEDYAAKIDFKVNYNFVPVERKKSGTVFIPFDGQQRLTTLFLLHFYVGSVMGYGMTELAGRFCYKTRKSAKDFCGILIDHMTEFSRLDEPIGEFVKNRPWFYESWERDPTISGMLVMLEAIQGRFKADAKNKEVMQRAWVRLTLGRSIVFDYLNLDEHALSDRLYVKMNARGKPLTAYENFKSWLIEYINKQQFPLLSEQQAKDWQRKLDRNWYDLFWKVAPAGADDMVYTFFKQIALFIFLADENKELKAKYEVNNRLGGNDFVPLRFYETHQIFNENSLCFIFYLLDSLCKSEFNHVQQLVGQVWNTTFRQSNNDFKHILLRGLADLNFSDRVYIFGILLFLQQSRDHTHETMVDWLRISRNLIYNTRIDDFSTRFVPALISLSKLQATILNPLDLIRKGPRLDFFSGKQQMEEELKLNEQFDAQWQEVFRLAENHHYLYGQISFVLGCCKRDQKYDLERFWFYFRRLESLFFVPHLISHEFLIQRALLSLDHDWMPNKGSWRFSLCKADRATVRDREENWRAVLEDGETTNRVRLLLETCDCTTTSLRDLIDQAIQQQEQKNWQHYLLEDPTLIIICSQRLVNWQLEGKHVRLLRQSRLSHYHRELRTSVLFSILRQSFNLDANHYKEQRSGSEACFFEVPVNGSVIAVGYDIPSGQMYYRFVQENGSDFRAPDESLRILSSELYDSIAGFDTYQG